jgi:hypothetical protein
VDIWKFSTQFYKNVCYILYDPNLGGLNDDRGEQYANGMVNQLKAAYNGAVVNVIQLSKNEPFADVWSSMERMEGSISMVVLIGHGNETFFQAYTNYLENGKKDPNPDNHVRITLNEISNLASKSIETVFIAGCTSTRTSINIVGGDTASAFLQISGVRSVVAFDGFCIATVSPFGNTRFFCSDIAIQKKQGDVADYHPFVYDPDAVGVTLLTVDNNGALKRGNPPLYDIGMVHSFNIAGLCKKLGGR